MDEKKYYVSQMDYIQVSDQMKQRVLQYENTKKKVYWKPITAVAAIALVLVMFVIPSPLSTQVNAYCEEVFYTIDELIYGQHTDVTAYTTEINQTKKDGDLAVQLNEVLLDGNHFTLKYKVISDVPRFFTIEEENSATYEGYYDLAVERITINGKSKEYSGDELAYSAFVQDSEDGLTYIVGDDICLHDFQEMLENPNEMIDVKIDVIATDFENEDNRHYSFAFSVENRMLQLETKEIPFEHTLTQDDVTFTFEKICMNARSQKIYFYVTGLPDQGFDICMTPENRSLYHFSLEGTDNRGNEVFCTLEELRDGYGYFRIRAYSDVEGLDPNVEYYDLQMEYIWDDPEHLVGMDEEESIFYGREGTVGERFRIVCNE